MPRPPLSAGWPPRRPRVPVRWSASVALLGAAAAVQAAPTYPNQEVVCGFNEIGRAHV